MHGKRLLFASPLIAALVFGTVDISQASVVPASVSAGDSHTTATPKVAPPVCRNSFKGELREMCSNGWSEGFTAGKASCTNKLHSKSFAPELEDAVYVTGFTAGFNAGKATC